VSVRKRFSGMTEAGRWAVSLKVRTACGYRKYQET